MGFWIFEHAQHPTLTYTLWKCVIVRLQGSLWIVLETLNWNILNTNNVLAVQGQIMRPQTPPRSAVRCGCDQFAIRGGVSGLCGCEPEGTICLVFSSADLDRCGCFWPTGGLAQLCWSTTVGFILCSQTFALAHFSFSCFSQLLFYPYSYFSCCLYLFSPFTLIPSPFFFPLAQLTGTDLVLCWIPWMEIKMQEHRVKVHLTSGTWINMYVCTCVCCLYSHF